MGYAVVAVKQGGEAVLAAREAWRVSLPGVVLALVGRDPTDPVHSYVKVRMGGGVGMLLGRESGSGRGAGTMG